MKKESINQKELKSLVSCSPHTGEFTCLFNRQGGKWRIGQRPGTIDKNGYLTISIWGKHYFAHRLAWLYMTGEWPNGHLDHKNGIPNDNRFRNLREATYSQNHANRRPYKGRSLPKGVTQRSKNSFAAHLGYNKKQIYLGSFKRIEQAHAAYLKAAKHHFGEFARSE